MNESTERSVRCTTILVSTLMILASCGRDTAQTPTRNEQRREVNQPSIFPLEPPPKEIEVEETKSLDSAEVSSELEKLKQGKKGKALHKHLMDQGFEPGKKPNKDLYGQRVKYKHPDKPNVKFTHTLVLQNYEKKGSSDVGALATMTLTSKDQNETQTTTYDFVLIAPDGQFESANESTATDEGKVVPANSWWSCVTSRITQKCVGTCVASIGTCTAQSWGSWPTYLGCLAVTCGYCLTKAVACCSCDCSWWCSWGAGCCDR